MKITLEKGHHNFGKERKVFNQDGTTGMKQVVSPGDTFEVTADEFKNTFTNRARYADPVATEEEFKFDPVWLKTKTAKELKVFATERELDFAKSAGVDKMVEILMDAAPDDEEPVIEWGADRLKAYLEKAEVDFNEDSNLLELAIEAFNA